MSAHHGDAQGQRDPNKSALVALIARHEKVRAKTKRGTTRYDPSPDTLIALVRSLNQDDRFLVVERLDAAEGTRYAQVLIDHDATWVMEYREGDGRHHFQALTKTIGVVEEFLVGWLTSEPGRSASLEWRTLLS
jgi:hypothetical protein